MSIHIETRTNSFSETRLIRNQFSPPIPHSIEFPPESRFTKQSSKDECDINIILARYTRTGELPALNEKYPQYLDVNGMDFHAHQNVVAQAKSMFAELPSHLRDRFKNDPALFVEFTTNPNNRTELAELGLLSDSATQAVLAARDLKTQPAASQPAVDPSENNP